MTVNIQQVNAMERGMRFATSHYLYRNAGFPSFLEVGRSARICRASSNAFETISGRL